MKKVGSTRSRDPENDTLPKNDRLHQRTTACAAAFLLAAVAARSACAADCAPADPSLAGHYWRRGVMEVGSELELKRGGRFAYMLAYGALDELASGCWTRKGDVVTLHAARFETSMQDPAKFDGSSSGSRRGAS